MAKKFLTQQEKIHLRNLKNRGQKLTSEAKKNIFGDSYQPNFNYNTNRVEKY